MNINDKFSEGGYAPELKAEYQGFGYAKLSIMLSLPDEVNEVLTPDLSKSEIQQLKEDVDEEKKTTDIEVISPPCPKFNIFIKAETKMKNPRFPCIFRLFVVI